MPKSFKDITLWQFQQSEKIMQNNELDDIEKTAFVACLVFEKTTEEVDAMGRKEALKMFSKVEKIFKTEVQYKSWSRIGKLFLNYNMDKISFGQYIELSFFLASPNPIHMAQYILASASNKAFRKNTAKDHKQKSDYFLKQPVHKAIGCINEVARSFKLLNDRHKALFETPAEGEPQEQKQEDPFEKRYGWTYCATLVADYYKVELSKAFDMPAIKALNALIYLKAKRQYDEKQYQIQKMKHGG
jgi:hypothetical protein